MENHFRQVLAPSTNTLDVDFIQSKKFDGKKIGYVFKNGPEGLGYYVDGPTANDSNDSKDEKRKRRRQEDENEDLSKQEDSKRLFLNDKSNIEKLLEEAEVAGLDLDANSLKQLLLSFEKKINKNQKMRMKYPNEPEKFMESEIELNTEINNLYAVAASPELYPILVQSSSINSILGMIAHENTDVSISSIGLLQELTEPDTVLEVEEAMCIVDALTEGQGLELLIQNLSRLDEANDEDVQGVYNTMAIIENLIELKPSIAVLVCEKTHILKFLLMRLKVKKMDANKLYCSEILSILLQSDSSNQKRLGNLSGVDGIDLLLQAISQYRKKDPISSDEEECVENLFLSLCNALMITENQTRFRLGEGIELMVRCIREQKYAAGCAVRVLNYAIANNKMNCERLVDAGGLKLIFPMLMKRALPKQEKKKGNKKEFEVVVLGVISQLCIQLHETKDKDMSTRLLVKLTENEYEKLERCAELFIEYTKLLEQNEITAQQRRLEQLVNKEDPEEIDADTPEERYLQRLDGGLYRLQLLAIILAFCSMYDFVPGKSDEKPSITRINRKLSADSLSIEKDVLSCLRELVANMDVSGSEGSDGVGEGDLKRRQILIEWCAALAVATKSNYLK